MKTKSLRARLRKIYLSGSTFQLFLELEKFNFGHKDYKIDKNTKRELLFTTLIYMNSKYKNLREYYSCPFKL